MTLSGAKSGAGGDALARHLSKADVGEESRPGESRGLFSESTYSRVMEISAIASKGRSRRPLYHVHVDPKHPWPEDQWAAHWRRFEVEFSLQHQPFVEAVHVKNGREHRHRVYSLVRPDGTTIRVSHDYARREKLARVSEVEFGEEILAGRHNRAAMHALEAEGRHDVVLLMREAGLDTMLRPQAGLTPAERHQQQRTGRRFADVRSDLGECWRAGQCGASFKAALEAMGYRLAQGSRSYVVVDKGGHPYSLRRCLQHAEAGCTGVNEAAVGARLTGLQIPKLATVRAEIRRGLAAEIGQGRQTCRATAPKTSSQVTRTPRDHAAAARSDDLPAGASRHGDRAARPPTRDLRAERESWSRGPVERQVCEIWRPSVQSMTEGVRDEPVAGAKAAVPLPGATP